MLPARPKQPTARDLTDSIRWALDKERALQESSTAHDERLFVVWTGPQPAVPGWRGYVEIFDVWMDPEFMATVTEIRDLQVHLSRSGDMNRFGFEGILTAAAWAESQGVTVAPRNWGSQVGFYMMLHVGRAITTFYRAENDPLEAEILVADGFSIRDGWALVPDVPGSD